jgi:hypothetical protein
VGIIVNPDDGNKDAGSKPLLVGTILKEEVPVEDDDEEDNLVTAGGVWLGIVNTYVVVHKYLELAQDRDVMGLCLLGMSLLILLLLCTR